MTNYPSLSLDGRWQFWTDPDAALSPSTLPPQPAYLVDVPAPWQAHPELRHYTGVAWYRCEVEIPENWLDGRTLILGFGAADYLAEVWFNEVYIGEHAGGYLPFTFDVSQAAHPGRNTLTVRITDPLELFPEIPHGKQSWYGLLSGLWQSVWLESRPPTHLVRLVITPQDEQVAVTAVLNQPLSPGHSLTFELFAPDGRLCAGAEGMETAVILPIPSPQLWDVDTPNLYTICVTLDQHTISGTFGFRTIETRGGQLWLNGRPLYLRGALDQDYYPDLIATPPSEAYLEDQFRKAKAMGLNCLRLHIKIGDPRYYAAADRVGLLIWTELPNWQILTPATQQHARDTLFGMVQRDWNHPSIIIWTIVNESWGVDLTNPEHRAWLAETYHALKQLDPHRLVVGNSACEGNFHVISDLADFHNYYAIPDHYDRWHDWVENLASRPAWLFAHQYESYKTWRSFVRQPWKHRERPPAAEIHIQGDEPLLVSEFGNWGLPDVASLRQQYGGEPWWFETGLEWGEGVVYPHGVEERFQLFHLDRVFPTLSALSAASQQMQFAALKYEIEQIRRQPTIAGYVITEFTDAHWECNGLLDMHRQPKVYFEAIGRINHDDLIIPHWKRLTFWEGERCEMTLFLSHFSTADLRDGRLEWQLDISSNVAGAFGNLAPTPAGVTRLGKVTFQVPAVERGTRARLEFRLADAHGRLITHNEQELTFFPRQPAVPHRLFAPTLARPLQQLGYTVTDSLETADVALVETMTDEMRHHLLRGGRVLWLAESANSLQTHLGSLKIRQRQGSAWQGDWASTLSWLRQDKWFSDIPSKGIVDFAFADVTPEHVLQGFHPRDFATDVYAGLFVGWLHKNVALVAERRVGRGHLLISTFRLSKQLTRQPVAAVMLNDMLRLVAGG
jgi:hypothetical protein